MEHQKKAGTRSMEMDTTASSRSARLQGSSSDDLGQSCRVYCPATGRVPFEWEDEPGKPKSSSSRLHAVPPLCPSPAMQNARVADRHGKRWRKAGAGRSSGTAGFEGCLPLRLNFGWAMKR